MSTHMTPSSSDAQFSCHHQKQQSKIFLEILLYARLFAGVKSERAWEWASEKPPLLRTSIYQIWPQPSLHLHDCHSLPRRIIFQLIRAYLAHTEILCIGMRKIQPADRARRYHCVVFGQLDSGIDFRIEQVEQ